MTINGLKKLGDRLDGAVMQINTMRSSDVIAAGCTSASMVIGRDELERRVRLVHERTIVTDPYSGIMAALAALGTKRAGFVSPYPDDVAQSMSDRIEDAGIAIPAAIAFRSQGALIGGDAPFIRPDCISRTVERPASVRLVDTIVIACTQMRAAALIEASNSVSEFV
jgi:maleate isomerase